MSTPRPAFSPLGPFRNLYALFVDSFRLYFARFGRHVALTTLPLAVALTLSALSEWVYLRGYTDGPLAHLAAGLQAAISITLWVTGIGVACAFVHQAEEGRPRRGSREPGTVLREAGATLRKVLPATVLVGLAAGVAFALFWVVGLMTLYLLGLAPLAALEEEGRLAPSLRLSVTKTVRALLEVGFVQSGALCFTAFVSLFRLAVGTTSALVGNPAGFWTVQAVTFPLFVLLYAWVGVALSLTYRKSVVRPLEA